MKIQAFILKGNDKENKDKTHEIKWRIGNTEGIDKGNVGRSKDNRGEDKG